jgi:diguanylate cyclase (GGDEF)-like protein
VLEALPEPILLATHAGRLTALNRPGEVVRAAVARDHADARKLILAAAELAQRGLAGDPVPIGLMLDGVSLCYEVTARKVGNDAVVICRDVSAETSVREVLLESRQRYKQLVELAADFIWECDETGAFSFVSEPGAFGYPPDRLVGRQPALFVAAAGGGTPWPNRVVAPLRDATVAVKAADGQVLRLALDAGPIQDSHNGQRGVRGVGRVRPDAASADADATGRADAVKGIVEAMHAEWRAEDALYSCAALSWRAFAAAGSVIYGAGDEWVKLAEAGELPTEQQAGACLDALRDRHVHRMADAEGKLVAVALHCLGRRTGALVLWRMVHGADWQDAELAAIGGLDEPAGIAVRQAMEIRRLTRLSRSDSLTGLLNRRAFLLELTAALARASRQRTTGALIYLDLDNFKRLNDFYGHEAGNEALTGVAGILGSAIRPYDLAARLGGDEFAVWLEDISGRDAGRSARRVAAAIAAWSATQGAQEAALGASIGVAVFDPVQPESPEDLIERADRAMYRAKRTPGKPVAIARPRRSKGSGRSA